jgi:hypothetical protein
MRKKQNVRIIITFPNNDIGGDSILKSISKDLNKFRNKNNKAYKIYIIKIYINILSF